MREISNNYERIAKIYAPLTKIISFGGNDRTQNVFLPEIDYGNSVLVVGCGSVDFSIEVAKKGAKVTCLDISASMIDVLQNKAKRHHVDNNMEFVCCNVMDFKQFGYYDCVAVNYFLNVFAPDTMEEVFSHVIKFIRPDGKLFLADEIKSEGTVTKAIQKTLRPIIYHAHRLAVNNALHEIYDYVSLLKKYHFEIVWQKVDKSQSLQSIMAVRKNNIGGLYEL